MKYASVLTLLALLAGCGHPPIQQTPAGHYRTSGSYDVSDAAIDAAVDAGYAQFKTIFPELGELTVNIVYIANTPTIMVGGAACNGYYGFGDDHVTACLHGSYPYPPVPLLVHELLHTKIWDPDHKSPLWARVPNPSAIIWR